MSEFPFAQVTVSRLQRNSCMCTASVIAMLTVLPASAQQTPSTQLAAAAAEVAEEIVVTGSRIIRNGYEAPTPVSVLGADELSAQAALNIADVVNDLPSFSGSRVPHAGNSSTGNGTVGANMLNLRGLDPNRTLILFDGQRMVGATANGSGDGGAVDVNAVPNMLIERVDVVTGGASAAYGSDALAGVVNFVLDRDFTGVKGAVDGGVSNYGDNPNYSVSLSAGTPFANGRGHILIAGEHTWAEGVRSYFRPWTEDNWQMMINPRYAAGNGAPEYVVRNNVGLGLLAPGGLITAGPLKGTTFTPDGTPIPFNYGPEGLSGNYIIGGDWALTRTDRYSDLSAKLSRQVGFLRASYDVADNVTLYAQLHWAHSRAFSNNSYFFKFASETIRIDNAFLPEQIRTQMVALGLTNLRMGRNNFDLPIASPYNNRTFRRYLVGADGNFDAAGTNWTWDVYYQRSSSHNSIRVLDNLVNANYLKGIDSILVNGRAVCRVNADANPANDDPACKPFNYFGFGNNGADTIDYVVDNGYGLTRLVMNVVAATVTGEPFSTWAGPVSVAFGGEHRTESLYAFASAIDLINGFYSGNYKNSQGSNKVTEGFVETVIPLASGEAWAKSLDLNGAVRATDYSNSGYVTTWKVGASWTPVDDIRFRVTQSRDIRAPNMGDLFLGGRSNTGTQIDRFTNTTPIVFSVTSGNPSLGPEKANTTGAGVVLSPAFLPGFNASIDYYRINIKGAIATLNAQQTIDQCFLGVQQLCPLLVRDGAGVLTRVNIQPANVLSRETKGFDFEASYNLPLASVVESWDGDVRLRAMVNHVSAFKIIDNASPTPISDGAGALNGVPDWRFRLSATYDLQPFSITLTMNGIGDLTYSNDWLECQSGCPTSSAAQRTIENNHIDSATSFDLSINYKFLQDGPAPMEAFFVVTNLANTPPPIVGGNLSSGVYQKSDGSNYADWRLGRQFRAGIRFRM